MDRSDQVGKNVDLSIMRGWSQGKWFPSRTSTWGNPLVNKSTSRQTKQRGYLTSHVLRGPGERTAKYEEDSDEQNEHSPAI